MLLSCVVPNFNQDNKIMPSSPAAFSLQFPSLASGLSSDNENSPVDYFMRHHNHSYQHQQQQQQHQLQSQQHTPNSTQSSGSVKDEPSDEKRGRSVSPSISVDGSYACSQCSASFQTRDQLEKHEMGHSPIPPVSCKICQKAFANVYRLQRHMISHDESAGLRKFKCNDCDKAFKFKHHLKEHIRIHSGEKPFGCINCGKRFSHSGSYSSHMTSKKCISAGIKLNRSLKMDKALHNSQKRNTFLPQALQSPSNVNNFGLGGASRNDDTGLTPSPNGNAFMPMLPKCNAYDPMNAFFALQNFPNPFFPAMVDPRAALNPFSIRQLLASQQAAMAALGNDVGHNKTASPLHSDPEDMIEEVTEDASDEPTKLAMHANDVKDLREDRKRQSVSPNVCENSSSMSSSGHGGKADIKSEDDIDMMTIERNEDELKCGRCDKVFNHRTELAQHETVLCTMIKSHEEVLSAAKVAAFNASYNNSNNSMPMHSGSEDDRKVRVRTAISEDQQNILREYYASNPRPNRDEFRSIAAQLSLDSRVVQVWFQNNRSRERKLNNSGYGKQQQSNAMHTPLPHQYTNGNGATTVNNNIVRKLSSDTSATPFNMTQSVLNNQLSPTYSRSRSPVHDDQPLDLSIKKESSSNSSPSSSPRHGTAMLPSDEVMNLSRKSLPQYPPYVIPNAALGFVPMERLIQMAPEMARNSVMSLKPSESLSPASDKRSWKDEMNYGDDHYSNASAQHQPISQPSSHKRSYVKQDPEGEGQFICDQCDKAFNKQSSLARHKYEHSGQRPYKCQDCPKAFKHKHHLTEHKRLHTGEKPFQCSKCLKKFSHSGSYSQHMNHRYSYCKPYRE